MMISLIVAMGENRVIGVENRLPWHIPEDLKRFRQITKGHPIIMGRKTFESIGKALPHRTNIVVSRNPSYKPEGATNATSLKESIEWAQRAPGSEEIFVIGGGQLFQEAMPLVNRLYITIVHWPFEGDVFFPPFPEQDFREISKERLSESPPSSLRILERKSPILDWKRS